MDRAGSRKTKEFACELIISERVAERANLDVSAFQREEITVRNRADPIVVWVVKDVEMLPLLA